MSTIEQVKSNEVIEWKNGDECVFDNKPDFEFSDLTLEYLNQTAKVYCQFNNKHGHDMVVIEFSDGYCCASRTEAISKPETEAERNERDRLEGIDAMYMVIADYSGSPVRDSDTWKDCEVLYSAGYRKSTN